MRKLRIMGILNVTPDSFSDGGEWVGGRAVEHALQMLSEGADIIDVGGESTRPGAAAVSIEEELDRVIPVVAAIAAARPGCVISIDTSKAAVARAAVEAGATLINDISGLTFDPEMAATAAALGVDVAIMHIQGTPRTMQAAPQYSDVVDEVRAWLAARIEAATQAGIDEDRIIVDPGIGFGKTLAHNLELLARLDELGALGRPILVGTSRKSFIGSLTGRSEPTERLHGTSATHAIAIANGADILRVHDVAAAADVVAVTTAILGASGGDA